MADELVDVVEELGDVEGIITGFGVEGFVGEFVEMLTPCCV